MLSGASAALGLWLLLLGGCSRDSHVCPQAGIGICDVDAGTCNCPTGECNDAGQCLCDRGRFRTGENLTLIQRSARFFGRLTLNGTPLPDDAVLDGSPRGTLVLVDVQTRHQTRIALDERGAANFDISVFASHYDVLLESGAADEQSSMPPGQRVLIARNLHVVGETRQLFNVDDVHLSGEITFNGTTMADDAILDGNARGELLFNERSAGHTAPPVSLGERGPARWSTWLFAGQYRVSVATRAAEEQSALPPGQHGKVHAGRFAERTQYAWNVAGARVSGRLTLDGNPIADDEIRDGAPRGAIVFRNLWTKHDAPSVSLGEEGPGDYAAWLFAGTYAALVASGSSDTQTALPPGQRTEAFCGTLSEGRSRQNFDVESVRLSGRFSLRGRTVPDDAIIDGTDRGNLLFVDESTSHSADPIPLGELGPASYDAWLFSGNYTVFIDTPSGLHQRALPPSQRVRLFRGRLDDSRRQRNFEADDVYLQGEFTFDGLPISDDTVEDGISRGSIHFVNHDNQHTASTLSLGEIGPADFATWLFAGDYDVIVETNPAESQNALPPSLRTLVHRGRIGTSPRRRTFNAESLVFRGELAMNGTTLPNDQRRDGEPRANIVFVDRHTQHRTPALSLGERGPGEFETWLFESDYSAQVETPSGVHQSATPPNQRTTLLNSCREPWF